jgi:hypothetical protein
MLSLNRVIEHDPFAPRSETHPKLDVLYARVREAPLLERKDDSSGGIDAS